MVDLQKVYEQYAEQGVVVLGFNSADRREIAEELLDKYEVDYPSILDNSTRAQLVKLEDYRVEAVPTTYVIDRDGKVAAVWVGFEKDHARTTRVLRKLGIE